jgi:hypothetical protein
MQKGKQDNNCFWSLLSNEPSDRSWKNKMHHRHEMLDLVIVDGRLEVSHVTWLLVKSKDILLMQ